MNVLDALLGTRWRGNQNPLGQKMSPPCCVEFSDVVFQVKKAKSLWVTIKEAVCCIVARTIPAMVFQQSGVPLCHFWRASQTMVRKNQRQKTFGLLHCDASIMTKWKTFWNVTLKKRSLWKWPCKLFAGTFLCCNPSSVHVASFWQENGNFRILSTEQHMQQKESVQMWSESSKQMLTKWMEETGFLPTPHVKTCRWPATWVNSPESNHDV